MNTKNNVNNGSKKFFLYYANMEEYFTGDMSDKEIYAYQLGFKLNGSFNTREEAFKALLEKSDNDILEYWDFYEDDYKDDHKRKKKEPTRKEKLDYMKSQSDYYCNEYNDFHIEFGSEDYGVNTMSYDVFTEDEIKKHLGPNYKS